MLIANYTSPKILLYSTIRQAGFRMDGEDLSPWLDSAKDKSGHLGCQAIDLRSLSVPSYLNLLGYHALLPDSECVQTYSYTTESTSKKRYSQPTKETTCHALTYNNATTLQTNRATICYTSLCRVLNSTFES